MHIQGTPRERGSADAYYNRPVNPHYYVGGSLRVPKSKMTAAEIAEYLDGYNNETDRKETGGGSHWGGW